MSRVSRAEVALGATPPAVDDAPVVEPKPAGAKAKPGKSTPESEESSA